MMKKKTEKISFKKGTKRNSEFLVFISFSLHSISFYLSLSRRLFAFCNVLVLKKFPSFCSITK